MKGCIFVEASERVTFEVLDIKERIHHVICRRTRLESFLTGLKLKQSSQGIETYPFDLQLPYAAQI
jgi:hypothetical protein